MLFADKRALETTLQKQLLTLREKEINFYVQNCQAISMYSAVLSGFAYASFTQVAIPIDAWYIIKFAYLGCTASSMCLELIALQGALMLCLLGPGLALRGPDGAVDAAVEGLVEEYHEAYFCFFMGIVFFLASASIFAWLTIAETSVDWVICVASSGTAVITLYLVMKFSRRVFARFRLRPDEIVSSRFIMIEDPSAAAWLPFVRVRPPIRFFGDALGVGGLGGREGAALGAAGAEELSSYGLAYSREQLQLAQGPD